MSIQLSISSTADLPDSKHKMPLLGLGLWNSHRETATQSCLYALKAGYRKIDSAQYYENEEQAGKAIRESGIPRSEIFLTTKMLSPAKTIDETVKEMLKCIAKVDDTAEGYVDLYLIHSTGAGKDGRKMLWQALEKVKKMGKTRDIGVSNYGIGHVEEMKEYADVWPPVVNQIELHPWCQQREIVEYCEKNGIVIEAYCPIVRNEKANDPTLKSIAEKHKTSPNQVLIRWSLQKGWSPLPKSDNPDRIKSNADVYGFKLDDDDMKRLNDLDKGAEGAIVRAVSNE